MIKGIPVVLTVRTQSGTDAFGLPVYETREETVENVLVAPSSAEEIQDTLTLTGRKAVYTLGIPKGDAHEWEDTTVRFFGEVWHSIGPVTEGIEEMIPLAWNKKVKVERIET